MYDTSQIVQILVFSNSLIRLNIIHFQIFSPVPVSVLNSKSLDNKDTKINYNNGYKKLSFFVLQSLYII